MLLSFPSWTSSYKWHSLGWETVHVLFPVVLVPVRDSDIKLKLELSALHHGVFIETTNLQKGLQLPKCLVLFLVSTQTNKSNARSDWMVMF